MSDSAQSSSDPKSRSDSTWSLLKWIDALQRSDQMFYNMMMIEIWSVAQTMDEMNPGFWTSYMQNRQMIMQQQLEERKRREFEARSRVKARQSSQPRRPQSPLELELDVTLHRQKIVEQSTLVSTFSKALDQELSDARQAKYLDAALVVNLDSLEPGDVKVVNVVDGDLPPAGDESLITASPYLDQRVPKQIEQATVSPKASSFSSDNTDQSTDNFDELSLYATYIRELPHLLHPPSIQLVSPSSTTVPIASIAMNCWSTRRFLVPTSLGNDELFVLQRLDDISLAPGQTIICQLGFCLLNVSKPIHIALLSPLQEVSGLVARWGIPHQRSLKQTSIVEASIQLSNTGMTPCRITAKQALCQLTF